MLLLERAQDGEPFCQHVLTFSNSNRMALPEFGLRGRKSSRLPKLVSASSRRHAFLGQYVIVDTTTGEKIFITSTVN